MLKLKMVRRNEDSSESPLETADSSTETFGTLVRKIAKALHAYGDFQGDYTDMDKFSATGDVLVPIADADGNWAQWIDSDWCHAIELTTDELVTLARGSIRNNLHMPVKDADDPMWSVAFLVDTSKRED